MPKALLADNNQFYRNLLGDLLESMGFSVLRTSDGMEALEAAKAEEPDLFVLDLVMPKIDGQRLCNYLRKDPRFKNTPIIMITAIAAEMLKHAIPVMADITIAKGPPEQMKKDLMQVVPTLMSRKKPPEGVLGLEKIYPREIVSELLNLKAYHDVLLSSIAEGVLQVDREHKLYNVNQAAEIMLNRKEEELIGQEVSTLFGEIHQPKIQEILKDLEKSRPSVLKEAVVPFKQRTLRTFWSNLRGTWEQEGYIVILQDISMLVNKIHHLMSLNEMGKIITSEVDYQALLSLIMGITQEALNTEAGTLYLLDETAQELVFEVVLGEAGRSLKGKRLKAGQGLAGWVVEKGEPVLVADAQKDSRFYQEMDKTTGFITRSVVCVPIIYKFKVIGAIQCINKRDQGAFTAEDLTLLESIAAYSSIAIENSRLYQQLKQSSIDLSREVERKTQELTRSHKDLLALYELAQETSQTLNLQEVLDSSLRKVLEITRLKTGALFLLNEAGDTLELRFHRGLPPELYKALEYLPRGDYFEWQALKQRRAIFENQLEARSFIAPLIKKGGFRGLLCIPLISPAKVQGVISLGSKGPLEVDEVRLKFLLSVGGHIATAIENAHLYEELQRVNIQLRETDHLKSDFLTTISHNIRTPLTAITSYAQMLQERQKIGQQEKQILNTIIEQSQRLLGMAQSTLLMTRMEAGKAACYFQDIFLEPLLRQCLASLEKISSQHKITLNVKKGLPLVRADEETVRYVVENLLANAVKYTPQGGPVEVKVRKYEPSPREREEKDNPPLVVISVSDSGLGIAQRDLDKIFEKYTRLEQAQSLEIQGAGLGLYICQKAVEAHGGRIWAHSEPERGSTFYFTLPIAKDSV